MSDQPLILDPNGSPVVSQKYAPCPQCGRSAKDRVPSGGFGTEIYMICLCGYEFKELKWQSVTS